jgi:quinol-cytochrome oxidoreductase complex cytochrome b subunit
MAVEAQALPREGAAPRQRREREQELLVWPDLVFVEFISAVLFTLTFVVLSTVLNAPLLNHSNLNITPNPSKAPWYFMNLQELLLHMHPALAGVIVPTIALIVLAALPYVDRSNEGQGEWFSTKNSVRITVFSFVFTAVLCSGLVLYDQGRHVNVVTNVAQHVDKDWEWPQVLAPFQNVRAIQTGWEWEIPVPERAQLGGGGNIEHDGELNWPNDFTRIPMPFNGTSGPEWMQWERPNFLPGWIQALYWYDLNLNLPAFIVELLIPTALMVGLPILLIITLRKIGWVVTTRDGAIALFTGFMTVFWVLTIIGAGFRGAGQDLVLPWDVPDID